MSFLLAFLCIAAVAPFIREAMRRRMGALARKSAPGKFVQLSQGLTHYCWLGASEGPVVVCVHGLTTPSFVWNSIAKGLGEMGFRVLVYDLYGRGYSDRVRGIQDSGFFNTQLLDLMESQDLNKDITLLGYSMGGAIVPAFAAHHPEKLRQTVLVAPGGLGHDLGPMSRLMANLGILGTWAALAVYGRSMRKAYEAERDLKSSIPDVIDKQLAELRYAGFMPAVLSSLRGIMDEPLSDEHRAVAKSGLPVLAIWGEVDDIIPLACKDELLGLNPSAKNIVIDGAGHSLAYTDDVTVLQALKDNLI